MPRVQSTLSGDYYDFPPGTPLDPSKWRTLSERGPSEEAPTEAPTYVSDPPIEDNKGNVKSGDIASWLSENLPSGTGAALGGVAGGTIGTLLAPETGGMSLLLPLLAGGLGAGAGQTGQDLLQTGEVNPLNTGLAAGLDMIGGPLAKGVGMATGSGLRALGVTKSLDLAREAIKRSLPTDLNPTMVALLQRIMKSETAAEGTTGYQAGRSLSKIMSNEPERSIEAQVFDQVPPSGIVPGDTANKIREILGTLQTNAGARETGAADELYAKVMDALRMAGAQGDRSLVEKELAQKTTDQATREALVPTAGMKALLGGAGTLGTLGSWLLYHNPYYAALSAVAPYAIKAGTGLARMGMEHPNNLLSGAVTGLGMSSLNPFME